MLVGLIIFEVQIFQNREIMITWYHTRVERKAAVFVFGPVQLYTGLVVVTHLNYKQVMRKDHLRLFAEMCNI